MSPEKPDFSVELLEARILLSATPMDDGLFNEDSDIGEIPLLHEDMNEQGGSGSGEGADDGLFDGDADFQAVSFEEPQTTLDQDSSSELTIGIGGTVPGEDYDPIQVDGHASLDGALHIEWLDDFSPEIGDTFDILAFDSVEGRFSSATGLFGFANGDRYAEIVELEDRLQLQIKAVPGYEFSFQPGSASGQQTFGELLNADYFQKDSASIEGVLRIDQFFHFSGTFELSLGLAATGDSGLVIQTGMTNADDGGSLKTEVDAIDGVQSNDDFSEVTGIEASMLSFGGTDLLGFVGEGTPDFATDLATQDLFGFGMADLDLGLASFTPLAELLNSLSFTVASAKAGSLTTHGFGEHFQVTSNETLLTLNLGHFWPDSHGPPVVDLQQSFESAPGVGDGSLAVSGSGAADPMDFAGERLWSLRTEATDIGLGDTYQLAGILPFMPDSFELNLLNETALDSERFSFASIDASVGGAFDFSILGLLPFNPVVQIGDETFESEDDRLDLDLRWAGGEWAVWNLDPASLVIEDLSIGEVVTFGGSVSLGSYEEGNWIDNFGGSISVDFSSPYFNTSVTAALSGDFDQEQGLIDLEAAFLLDLEIGDFIEVEGLSLTFVMLLSYQDGEDVEFLADTVSIEEASADSISIELSDLLILETTDIAFDFTATGSEHLLVIGSLAATLPGVGFSGEARNFGLRADGRIFVGDDFGVSLAITGESEGDLALPEWLPISIDVFELQWRNFNSDPLDFTLRVSATADSEAIPGSPLIIAGSIDNLIIDVGLLRDGKFPIIALDGVGLAVGGDIAGNEVNGAVLLGVLRLDSEGQIIEGDDTETEVADRVLWGAIQGTVNIAGYGGFSLYLGLSELGPLQGYVRVTAPIMFFPPIGLSVTNLRAGIIFSTEIESVEDARDMRDNPSFTPAGELTFSEWRDLMLDALATQVAAEAEGQTFNILANPFRLEGGATIFSAYASAMAFTVNGDFLMDSTGKFLIIGTVQLGGEVTIGASLFFDVSKVAQGDFTVLFLGEFPSELPVATIYGNLNLGFGETIDPDNPPAAPFEEFMLHISGGIELSFDSVEIMTVQGSVDIAVKLDEPSISVDIEGSASILYIGDVVGVAGSIDLFFDEDEKAQATGAIAIAPQEFDLLAALGMSFNALAVFRFNTQNRDVEKTLEIPGQSGPRTFTLAANSVSLLYEGRVEIEVAGMSLYRISGMMSIGWADGGLNAFVDGNLRVGPTDAALIDYSVQGFLRLQVAGDSPGMAARLAVSLEGGIAALEDQLGFDASYELWLNTTSEDITLEIPSEFLEGEEPDTLHLPRGPPSVGGGEGSGDAQPYLVIQAVGSLNVFDSLVLEGDFQLRVADAQLTIDYDAIAKLGFGDFDLIHFTAEGSLRVNSDGIVGFADLSLAAGFESLPVDLGFQINADFSLRINTTDSVATVGDRSLAAGPYAHVRAEGSIVIGALSLEGVFEFRADDERVRVQASGEVALGVDDIELFSYGFDGQLSVFEDGIFATLSLTLENDNSTTFGLGIDATAELGLNTTGISRDGMDPGLGARILLDGSLTIAGQTLEGEFDFRPSTTTLFLSVDAEAVFRAGSSELLRVPLDFEVELDAPAIIEDFELEFEASDLGLDAFGIDLEGDLRLQINTSGIEQGDIPAGPIFRIQLDGTMALLDFELEGRFDFEATLSGIAIASSFSMDVSVEELELFSFSGSGALEIGLGGVAGFLSLEQEYNGSEFDDLLGTEASIEFEVNLRGSEANFEERTLEAGPYARIAVEGSLNFGPYSAEGSYQMEFSTQGLEILADAELNIDLPTGVDESLRLASYSLVGGMLINEQGLIAAVALTPEFIDVEFLDMNLFETDFNYVLRINTTGTQQETQGIELEAGNYARIDFDAEVQIASVYTVTGEFSMVLEDNALTIEVFGGLDVSLPGIGDMPSVSLASFEASGLLRLSGDGLLAAVDLTPTLADDVLEVLDISLDINVEQSFELGINTTGEAATIDETEFEAGNYIRIETFGEIDLGIGRFTGDYQMVAGDEGLSLEVSGELITVIPGTDIVLFDFFLGGGIEISAAGIAGVIELQIQAGLGDVDQLGIDLDTYEAGFSLQINTTGEERSFSGITLEAGNYIQYEAEGLLRLLQVFEMEGEVLIRMGEEGLTMDITAVWDLSIPGDNEIAAVTLFKLDVEGSLELSGDGAVGRLAMEYRENTIDIAGVQMTGATLSSELRVNTTDNEVEVDGITYAATSVEAFVGMTIAYPALRIEGDLLMSWHGDFIGAVFDGAVIVGYPEFDFGFTASVGGRVILSSSGVAMFLETGADLELPELFGDVLPFDFAGQASFFASSMPEPFEIPAMTIGGQEYDAVQIDEGNEIGIELDGMVELPGLSLDGSYKLILGDTRLEIQLLATGYFGTEDFSLLELDFDLNWTMNSDGIFGFGDAEFAAGFEIPDGFGFSLDAGYSFRVNTSSEEVEIGDHILEAGPYFYLQAEGDLLIGFTRLEGTFGLSVDGDGIAVDAAGQVSVNVDNTELLSYAFEGEFGLTADGIHGMIALDLVNDGAADVGLEFDVVAMLAVNTTSIERNGVDPGLGARFLLDGTLTIGDIVLDGFFDIQLSTTTIALNIDSHMVFALEDNVLFSVPIVVEFEIDTPSIVEEIELEIDPDELGLQPYGIEVAGQLFLQINTTGIEQNGIPPGPMARIYIDGQLSMEGLTVDGDFFLEASLSSVRLGGSFDLSIDIEGTEVMGFSASGALEFGLSGVAGFFQLEESFDFSEFLPVSMDTEFELAINTSPAPFQLGERELEAGPFARILFSGELELFSYAVTGDYSLEVSADGIEVIANASLSLGIPGTDISLFDYAVSGGLRIDQNGLAGAFDLELDASNLDVIEIELLSADLSFRLEVNTTGSAQTIGELELEAGPYARVMMDGGFTYFFYNLVGEFRFEVSGDGIEIHAMGEIELLVPEMGEIPEISIFRFGMEGFLNITGDGLAAAFELDQGLLSNEIEFFGLTLPVGGEQSFLFALNTTGKEVTAGGITLEAGSYAYVETSGSMDMIIGGYSGSIRFQVDTGGLTLQLQGDLRIEDFLYLEGNLTISLMLPQRFVLSTGIPSEIGSVIDSTPLADIATAIASIGGISIGEDFSYIDSLLFGTLAIGSSNMNGFIGLGTPDFDSDLHEQDLFGFAVQDVSIAGLVTQMLPPFPPEIPQLPSQFSMKASVGAIQALGFDDMMTLEAEDIEIRIHSGDSFAGTPFVIIPVLDLMASDNAAVDGEGNTLGFEVPTTGDPIYLDFDGEREVGIQFGYAEINLFGFVHLQGSFAFQSGSTETVNVSTGFPSNVAGLPGQMTQEVRTMTLGASDVQGFVGINGPYLDSEGDVNEAAFGLALQDFDLAMVMMQPTVAEFVPGLSLVTPNYIALKASVAEAGLVGFDDASASVQDIVIEVNSGTPWPGGLGIPVVDFEASFPGDEETPVGLPVWTGSDSIAIDFDGTQRIRAEVGQMTFSVSEFIHLQGSFVFEAGPRHEVDVATGLPGDILDVADSIGLGSVVSWFDDLAGEGIEFAEDLSMIYGLEVAALSISATDVRAFVGLNGPYLNTDGDINEDATGLVIEQVDVGLALFQPTLKFNPLFSWLPSFIAGKATADTVGLVGFEGFALQADQIELTLNTGTPWAGLVGPAVIDFAASFPEVEADEDGEGAVPPGFEVPGIGEPIYLDYDGNQRIGVEVSNGLLSLLDFVHLSGSFAFEMGPTVDADVHTGLSMDLFPDAQVIPGVEMSTMTIGASDVQAFFGINGPYFGDDLDEDTLGLYVDNLNFGLAVLQPTALSIIPGLDTFAPRFIGLQASADSAGLVGADDLLSVALDGIQLDINTATVSAGGIQPWINFESSFPAGEDNGEPVPTGLEVNTGSEPIYLDYSELLFRAEVAEANLVLADFVHVQGGLTFERGPRYEVVANSGFLEDLGTPAQLEHEVQTLTLGGTNLNAFIGLNGNLTETELPDSAVGLSVQDFEFALAFLTPTAFAVAGDDLAPKYIAAYGYADTVQMVGTDGIFELEGQELELSINTSSLPLPPGVVAPHIDFARSFESSEGANDGVFEVRAGSEDMTVDIDYSGELFIAEVSYAEVNVGGALSLAGSFAFELGPQESVTLTDGTNRNVRTMTIAAANVYGFMGFNGPYRTDTNNDLVIDEQDEVNESAVGLALNELNLGIALMTSSDVLDISVFAAGSATVGSIELVGLPGITSEATDMEVAFNLGLSIESGTAAIDFSQLDEGGLEVNTGNPDAPVVLDFEGSLMRASGIASIAVTLSDEPWFGMDGAFEFELTDDYLQTFVNGSLFIGPESDPLIELDAVGLFVLNTSGIALRADVDFASDSPLPGSEMDASLGLMLNTTGEEISYDLPDHFPEIGGESSVVIPDSAPGSDAEAGPYLYIGGSGSLTLLDSFNIDGEFAFRILPDAIEMELTGTTALTFGDTTLIEFTVDGSLALTTGGIYGSLQLSVASELPSNFGFSLSGIYQLEVNTTASTQTLERVRIDEDGQAVMDGEDGWVTDPVEIEAATARLNLAGQITLLGQDLNGYATFEVGPDGIEVAFNASLAILGLDFEVDGKGALILGNSRGIALDLALSQDGGLDFGIAGFTVDGSVRLRANTSGAEIDSIAGVDLDESLPAGPYFRIEVSGTDAETPVAVGFNGLGEGNTMNAGRAFIEIEGDTLTVSFSDLGVTIGSDEHVFGEAFFQISEDGVAGAALIQTGSDEPREIVPGVVLYGAVQLEINTTNVEVNVANFELDAGNYVRFSIGGLLELSVGGTVLLEISGNFEVEVTDSGDVTIELSGSVELGPLGRLGIAGILSGSESDGIFASLELAGDESKTLSGAGFNLNAKFRLELNLTDSTQTVSRPELDDDGELTGDTVDVDLEPGTVQIFGAGELGLSGLVEISGSFILTLSGSSTELELNGATEILGQTFQVQGGAAIYGGSNGGIALVLAMSVSGSGGLSGVGFDLEGDFSLEINTSSSQRSLAGSTLSSQSLRVAVENAELELLGLVELSGEVQLHILSSGFRLDVDGEAEMPFIGSLSATGELSISSSGIYGSIALGGSSSSASIAGVQFNGRFQLAINTTGSSQSVRVLNVNSNSGAVSGTRSMSLDAETLLLSFGGELNVAGFGIRGGAEMIIGSSQLSVDLDASLNLGAFGNLRVEGGAEFGRQSGSDYFALNMNLGSSTLSVATLNIVATFELEIDTRSSIARVSVDGDLNIWAFETSIEATIETSGGGFRMDFEGDLNFFNFATVEVSGYVDSNGTFSITGNISAGFNLGIFSANMNFNLNLNHNSFSANGSLSLSATIPVPVFPDISFSTSIGASMSFNVPQNSATLSISVDVGPFTARPSKTFTFGPPPVLGRLESGVLYVHTGADSNLRGSSYQQTGGESFSVFSQGGSAGNETITINGLGFEQSFSGVNKVVVRDLQQYDNDIQFIGVQSDVEVRAGSGNDYILQTGNGNVTAWLVGGDNQIVTGPGNNTIHGGSGDDAIYTGSGNDIVYAGSGNNYIESHSGNNVFYVGTGNDTIVGGSGNDTYIFSGSSWGDNEIIETAGGSSDTVDFSNATGSVHFELGENGRYEITQGSNRVVNDDMGVEVFYGSQYADTFVVTENGSNETRLRGQGGDDVYDITFGQLNGSVQISDMNPSSDVDHLIVRSELSGSIVSVMNDQISQGSQLVTFSSNYHNVDRMTVLAPNAEVRMTGVGSKILDIRNKLTVEGDSIVWGGLIHARGIDFQSNEELVVSHDLVSRRNAPIVLESSEGDIVLNAGIYIASADGLVGNGSGSVTLNAPEGGVRTNGEGWVRSGGAFSTIVDWALRGGRFSTDSIDFDTGEIRTVEGQAPNIVPAGTLIRDGKGAFIQAKGGELVMNTKHRIGESYEDFRISPLAIFSQVAQLTVNVSNKENANLVNLDSIQVSGDSMAGELRITNLTGLQEANNPISGSDDPIVLTGDQISVLNDISTTNNIYIFPTNPNRPIVILQNAGQIATNPDALDGLLLTQNELNKLLTSNQLVIGSDRNSGSVKIGDRSTGVMIFDSPSLLLRGQQVEVYSQMQTKNVFIQGSGNTTTLGDDWDAVGSFVVDDAVLIDGDLTITATENIRFHSPGTVNGHPSGGPHSLTLEAQTFIDIEGSIGGTTPLQNLTLSADSGNIRLRGSVNLSNDLTITQGNTLTFNGDVDIDGDLNISGVQNVVFEGSVNVSGAMNIQASNNVTFQSGVNVEGDASIEANGNVSASSNVEVSGDATIESTNLTFNQAVTIGGDYSITASNRIAHGGFLSIGGDTTLVSNEIDFLGGSESVSSSGFLWIDTYSDGQEIRIGRTQTGSTSVLDFLQRDIAALQNGFEFIRIGDPDGPVGAVSVGTATFQDSLSVYGSSVLVLELFTVNGNLLVDATEDVTIEGTRFEFDGSTIIGRIQTNGGDLSILAVDGLLQKTGGDLIANGGSIDVDVSSGGIEMQGTARALTNGANIRYEAEEDIVIGRLDARVGADRAGDTLDQQADNWGRIEVVSHAGAIADIEGDTGIDIFAREARFEALNGVGAIGASEVRRIETEVITLVAVASSETDNWGIHLRDATDVTVDSVDGVVVNRVQSDGSSEALSAAPSLNHLLAEQAGSILLESAAGSVTIHEDARIETESGDIVLRAAANVSVARLISREGGDISVTAGDFDQSSGSILDNLSGGDANISTAGHLSLEAATGIGSSGSGMLVTSVASVEAVNRISDDIYLYELDGLTVSGLETLAGDGSIVLQLADGDLSIDGEVSAHGSGSIRLETLGNGGDITIHSDLSSESGHITLRAEGGIDLSADVAVSANEDGSIMIEAAHGSFTMAGSASLDADTGNLILTAEASVTLGNVVAADAAIQSLSGSILNATGSTLNIEADNLRLEADGDIGEAGRHLSISINIGILSAASATGGIFLSSQTTLIVGAVTVSATEFTADGTTSSVDVASQAGLETAENGDIVLVVAGTIRLDEAVAADGEGSVRLAAESGALQVQADVSSDTGRITLIGVLRIELIAGISVSTNADVSLKSSGAGIEMHGTASIEANGSSLRLSAQDDLTLGNLTASSVSLLSDTGAILNAEDSTLNVSADELRLEAQASIASSGRHLSVDVDSLTAESKAGSIFITAETGVVVGTVAVTVEELTSDAGTDSSTDASQSGLTTLDDGDIVLVALTGDVVIDDAVSSDGKGRIRLEAQSGSLSVDANITSGSGWITLYAETDLNISEAISIESAADIRLDANTGELVMHGTAVVEATDSNLRLAAENDIVVGNLRAANVSILSVSGAIVNAADSSLNVDAEQLRLESVGAIAAADRHLSVDVNTVTALSEQGGIFITSESGLAVGDVEVSFSGLTATAGEISHADEELSGLTTLDNGDIILVALTGSIDVDSGVSANGEGRVLLSAEAGALIVNADIFSDTGLITLQAETAIEATESVVIESAADISLTAQSEGITL
ncbi:MAG: hypothetical protein JJU20_06760, partial [Opitutales bacterium]|nr:hypothetical protein [Opitutales bacterium]